jgi:hypothetical protein
VYVQEGLLYCSCVYRVHWRCCVRRHRASDFWVRHVIVIDSDQLNYFACALWEWFAASPTPNVLRFLDIRIAYFDQKDIGCLVAFLNSAACSTEIVAITLGVYTTPTQTRRDRLTDQIRRNNGR